MKKKLLSLSLALLLLLSLAACGGSASQESDAQSTEDAQAAEDAQSESEEAGGEEEAAVQTLSVGCSAVPHAVILEEIKDTLAAQNIDLQIQVYGDYVVPNTAVDEGVLDANFFQHKPYLDNFNAERGTHLVSVAGIHVEPMGIYGGKTAALEDLTDGAVFAIPNDPTNEGRALLLLQAQGLIGLKEDAGLEATPNDIALNPNNLQFQELEAAMVPNILSEVDFAVINVNYALEAGLDPAADSLAIESADSPYVNIVAVREGNENDPRILALVDALQSDAVRDFITETYGGAVVATF